MTCVAYDGKTLAADKRAICPDGMVRTVTKIRKKGKLLYGVAGALTVGMDLMQWVEDGRDPATYPSAEFGFDEQLPTELLVIDNGKILKYEHSAIPCLIEDRTFAIGSGAHYAMAAMYLGKTAAEAIEVAAHFDSYVGNGVDKVSLK